VRTVLNTSDQGCALAQYSFGHSREYDLSRRTAVLASGDLEQPVYVQINGIETDFTGKAFGNHELQAVQEEHLTIEELAQLDGLTYSRFQISLCLLTGQVSCRYQLVDNWLLPRVEEAVKSEFILGLPLRDFELYRMMGAADALRQILWAGKEDPHGSANFVFGLRTGEVRHSGLAITEYFPVYAHVSEVYRGLGKIPLMPAQMPAEEQ